MLGARALIFHVSFSSLFVFPFCLVALSMIISGCYARMPSNGNGQGRPLSHNKIIIQAGIFLRNEFGLLPATHSQKRTEKSLLYLSPCFDFFIFFEEIPKAGQKNYCVYVYVMGRGEREGEKMVYSHTRFCNSKITCLLEGVFLTSGLCARGEKGRRGGGLNLLFKQVVSHSVSISCMNRRGIIDTL